MRARRDLVLWVAAFSLSLLAGTASATILVARDIVDLARGSTAIVVGRVRGRSADIAVFRFEGTRRLRARPRPRGVPLFPSLSSRERA